jgi:flagellar motor switch protein FliN
MSDSSAAATVDPEGAFSALGDGASTPDESTRAPGRKRGAKSDDAALPRQLQPTAGNDRLDLLGNIEMDVTAELGRTRMTVRELLSLTPGIVVELDRIAGSPIDLFVNGTLIAHGEVVVIDEEFGVRISEIVGPTAAENTR